MEKDRGVRDVDQDTVMTVASLEERGGKGEEHSQADATGRAT